ncbi:MAG: sugar phosphate nucleotidyltransferase [Pseudomonadota bacterium]
MTSSLLGIIPAAGSGVRARPYSYEVHKGLFAIDGKSNIERNIDIMRDEFDIKEIVIIVGYMADAVRENFGDGSDFDVKITYIENHHLDKGWAWSILLAKPYLAGRYACVMLSDEFYLESNHGEFYKAPYEESSVTIAYKHEANADIIKKNFSVERDGQRVIRLLENPTTVSNDILGIASFLVNPDVFNLLEAAYDSGRPAVEFINFIDELITGGHKVSLFELTGDYINLNDVAALEAANDLAIRARLVKENT